jgi:hypothetical protein
LAVNCGGGVRGFLAAATMDGAPEGDGQVALGIARKIKQVAAGKDATAAWGESAEEERSCTPGEVSKAAPACC